MRTDHHLCGTVLSCKRCQRPDGTEQRLDLPRYVATPDTAIPVQYLSRLPGRNRHGGGANTSEDETRVGVFLHYTLNWLRQEENQYLSCPPEHAEHLTQELRALIGYAKGGYVLGFYSDPDDDSAQHESVSPENLFSQHRGDFDVLPTEEQLVSQSTPKS